MKKLLLFVFMTSALATTAVAQQQSDVKPVKDVKEVKKDQADWDKTVKDELKLTDEQTQKYDALSAEYKTKIDAVLQDASLTKEVQKEKKMALKKEKQARLYEFLTPEQQTKYQELVDKKMKEKEAAPRQGS